MAVFPRCSGGDAPVKIIESRDRVAAGEDEKSTPAARNAGSAAPGRPARQRSLTPAALTAPAQASASAA